MKLKVLNAFLLLKWLTTIPDEALAQQQDDAAAPILDERVMQLSVEAARLSMLAYANATEYAVAVDEETNATLYEHPDYESIFFYNDEPDQAIVAKTKDGGRCYLAFRGTTTTIDDWFQNFGLGSIDVYKDNDMSTGESCSARGGFADFLLSDLVGQGGEDLIACAVTCADPDDCIVLTGHSQGGAVALLASILLYSFNPILITFGQPLAVQRDCDLIRSERIYRYVNSVAVSEDDTPDTDEPDNIEYDPVPLLPAAFQGRGHYGYYLLLGDDTTALKFLGVDGEDSGFRPGPQLSATPHKMGAFEEDGTVAYYSYEARVTALYDNNEFPVETDGFSADVPCDEDNPLLCASDVCDAVDVVCTAATASQTSSPTVPAAEQPTKSPSSLTIQPSPSIQDPPPAGAPTKNPSSLTIQPSASIQVPPTAEQPTKSPSSLTIQPSPPAAEPSLSPLMTTQPSMVLTSQSPNEKPCRVIQVIAVASMASVLGSIFGALFL